MGANEEGGGEGGESSRCVEIVLDLIAVSLILLGSLIMKRWTVGHKPRGRSVSENGENNVRRMA